MRPHIPPAESQLLARLERLPISRPHLRLMFMGGLGIAFDGMDGSLVSYLLPAITPLWGLEHWQTGLIGSSLLIGIMVGALAAGLVGDAYGRRTVMMYALAVFCTATLVAALAPNWEFFFAARIVAGIGIGAEAAIIPAFISEFIPARRRGLFVGSVAGCFSLGYIAAAALGRLMVPELENGWRIAQIVTAVPVLILLWWRRSLPESPRWLIQKGRMGEAEKVISALETDVVRATGRTLPPVENLASTSTVDDFAAETDQPKRRHPLVEIWRNGLAQRTAVLWLLWASITFAYYGFFIWIPSLLVEQGMPMSKSFTYVLIMTLAQIPGYYSAAFLSERFDRKWTIAAYLAGGVVSGLLFAQFGAGSTVLVLGALLSFFMNGTYAAMYAYTPEVYPTAIRATGMGAASAFGRIGGIVSPILIGMLYPTLGFGGVFALIAGALGTGALAVLCFGVNTSGRTLEQLNQPSTMPDTQADKSSHTAGKAQ